MLDVRMAWQFKILAHFTIHHTIVALILVFRGQFIFDLFLNWTDFLLPEIAGIFVLFIVIKSRNVYKIKKQWKKRLDFSAIRKKHTKKKHTHPKGLLFINNTRSIERTETSELRRVNRPNEKNKIFITTCALFLSRSASLAFSLSHTLSSCNVSSALCYIHIFSGDLFNVNWFQLVIRKRIAHIVHTSSQVIRSPQTKSMARKVNTLDRSLQSSTEKWNKKQHSKQQQ